MIWVCQARFIGIEGKNGKVERLRPPSGERVKRESSSHGGSRCSLHLGILRTGKRSAINTRRGHGQSSTWLNAGIMSSTAIAAFPAMPCGVCTAIDTRSEAI